MDRIDSRAGLGGRLERTAQVGIPWVSLWAATAAMRATAAKVREYFILID